MPDKEQQSSETARTGGDAQAGQTAPVPAPAKKAGAAKPAAKKKAATGQKKTVTMKKSASKAGPKKTLTVKRTASATKKPAAKDSESAKKTPAEKSTPEPKSNAKQKKSPSEALDESVIQHIRDEKAATVHADETAIDHALDNLRKDNNTSSLPDPAALLDAITPDATQPPEESAGSQANSDDDPAPLTGIFGVLDRAQNAMAAAQDRLVAEANEPPKSQRRLQIALIIGGLVILLGAGAFVWYQMSSRVAVPNLIGMSQTSAVATLNKGRLKVGQLLEQQTVNAPPGTVIDQDPGVDVKVARNTAVTLTVAAASDQVKIPSVTDLSPTDATTKLTGARLVYQEVKTFSDTVPPGQIVGQIPVAGTTVESGSTVLVLVSQGSMQTPVTVPRVLGLSKADAAKLLGDQGFTPLFYYAQTAFGTINEAVTQTPASTGLALPGSVVMVLISQGNSKSGMIVPDVCGLDEATAKKKLQDAGFNVDERQIATSSADAGNVVAQTPQATDTHLEAGATVGLLVSVGSDPAVKVPSMLGASLSAAQARIRALGLDVVAVPLLKGQQPGIITQQFPAGGLAYQLGLPVLLYAPPQHDQSSQATP